MSPPSAAGAAPLPVAAASADRSLPRGFVWLLVAALLLQLLIALLGLPPGGRELVGDEVMYRDLARDWAAGGSTAIDPLWPPGYPQLFALWIRATANETGFLLLQVAALGVAMLSLARLTLRLTGDPVAAALAAGLLGLAPQVAAFAQYFWPEAIHLAVALSAFELALARAPSRWRALALGLLGAAALLLKSVLLPVIPLLLLAHARRAAARRLALLAISTAAFLLPLVPTLRHNIRSYGLYAVSDSTAFNAILGFTERERRSLGDRTPGLLIADYLRSAESVAGRRAWLDSRLSELVRSAALLPELAERLPRQLFRLFDRESQLAAMLPGGSLAAQGLGYHQPPTPLARVLVALDLAIYAALLLAAPWGLALLLRSRPPGAGWIAGWLVYLLAIFLALHVTVRFRVLLFPALAIAAAAAIAQAPRWLPRRNSRPRTPLELPGPIARLMALAASATLLYFAFALP